MDDTGRCMEELSAATRDAGGRQQLAESPLLPALAASLPQAVQAWREEGDGVARGAGEKLLQLLRVLRNVCACGAPATAPLLQAGVHEQAAALAAHLPGSGQLPAVAAQLLANLAASGRAEAAAVWGACWPDAFAAMAAAQQGPLPMILYHCCRASEALTAELCSPGGALVLTPLLEQLAAPEAGMDTHLEMLAAALCYQRGSLPGLDSGLPPPQLLPNLRAWHAGLLQAAAEALQGPASQHLAGLEPARGERLAATALRLADSLAQRSVCHTPLSAGVLRACLQFLRCLTAADDSGARVAQGRPVVSCLVTDHGLVARVLGMLAGLGPLKSLSRSQPAQPAAWPACPRLPAEQYAASQPYQGYRTDLVTVLANAAFRRTEVQDSVQALGGVELILAHCQVDEESPLLREAGLWAVRNLCEGNAAVQRQIEALQVVGTVQTPELDRQGLQLQHDPATGKLNLVDAIND